MASLPHGIYYLLNSQPVWITFACLYFLGIGLLHLIRDRAEGLGYNVAWSSQYGDLAFIIVIAIGCDLLQQKRMSGLLWEKLDTLDVQFLWLIASVSLGTVWQFIYGTEVRSGKRVWGTIADGYHNRVITSLFCYLLGLLVPLIFACGTSAEKLITIGCFLFWCGCLIYDRRDGRLQQTEWLTARGISLPPRKT